MNGFSAAISGVGSAVGRYFSVVSFIPSLFLTGFIFALIESGAWSDSGSLNWTRAGRAFTHIGDLALLILISIVIGIAVHPIQFALVQFFEGYWGTRWWAQRARTARIMHHVERYQSFHTGLALEANDALRESDSEAMRQAKRSDEATSPEERRKADEAEENARLPLEDRVRYRSISDENRRLARGYPDVKHVGHHVEYDNVMPTRLGNVLRRYERRMGSQYSLEPFSVIQQISFVAPAERLAYIGDQRQLLDLSVRMSATSIVATLIAISALWRHGPWLLLALLPYGVAYLSYRGAVVVAHEYGSALSAMIDLDRFALYDALRLPRPKDTAAERRMNRDLGQLLSHNRKIILRYEYPDVPGSTSGQSTST